MSALVRSTRKSHAKNILDEREGEARANES